jgi:hypothetical protein
MVTLITISVLIYLYMWYCIIKMKMENKEDSLFYILQEYISTFMVVYFVISHAVLLVLVIYLIIKYLP